MNKVLPLIAISVILLAPTGIHSVFADVSSGSITGGSVFGSGAFIELTPPLPNPFGPPNSVGDDTFQNDNFYAFNEGQNILIPAPLAVDDLFGPPGAGFIPTNTIVASHYVFFDPGPTRSVIGTVTFDSNILGVISSTGNLAASDFLINNGVNYLNPGARGLEGQDFVTIDDATTISVNWAASTPGDYIRVITEFSPGGEEVCDGIDNDGDGDIDEGLNCDAIGGEIIPINSASLLVAGAQTSALWLIPLVLSAVAVGIVLVRKN